MANRAKFFVFVFLLICCTFLAETETAYIPKSRGAAAAVEAIKRSVAASGARQKRYTDYQERASAFCTGLCMYEERKSYSECFDLCNWPITGDSRIHESTNNIPYDYLEPANSPTFTDTDYINDEGVRGPLIEDSQGVQGQGQRDGQEELGAKRRKGKKEKGRKDKAVVAKQKKLLKTLKRKLIKDIDEKQHVLVSKAQSLEDTILGLSDQISENKQTITELEENLDHIRKEMDDIDEMKTNITQLIKGHKKLGMTKLQNGDITAENFLLPLSKFEDGNMKEVLNDFLVKGKTKRDWSDMSRGRGLQPFELYGPDDMLLVNKRLSLDEAAERLNAIGVTNEQNMA